jgi:alkanesulfonate monooxygenase SsuD/methylene tetrahydromethanopterin reductase-like flavin-dependent oxidoreductase (luciferase family)
VEFGIFDQLPCAPSQKPAERYRDIIEQCHLADKLGLDSVWLAEYHFSPRFSIMPAPLLAASAIAQCTERVKIGTAVNLLPLHQPVRLAEEVATLDLLSQGRALFGIGRGSNISHYEGLGIPVDEGRPRFIEALDIVLKAWTEDQLTYEGRFYQVPGVQVVPKPYQQPHPPVYIAANSPDTFPLVGALGHNILVTPLIITRAGVQQRLEVYRQELDKHGHDPAKVKVIPTLTACVAESRKKAHAILEPTLNNYLSIVRQGRSQGAQRALSLTSDDIFNDFAIAGDPEECIDRITEFKELFGCQGFMLWLNIGGLVPNEEVCRSMRLFAEKVMPRFR